VNVQLLIPEPRPWRNWHGNDRFDVRLAAPRDEREVVDLVRAARDRRTGIRLVGAAHSSSPIFQTAGILVSLEALTGITGCTPDERRVSLLAGTRIHDLGDPLWHQGLALTNQGDIDSQTVAGAIATGTHGSGLGLQSMSAALRRARLVAGTGEVIEVDESRPELLHAAQVSIGMLGVMIELELAVSEAYELAEWIGHVPLPRLQPQILQLARAHRHFSFFWLNSHRAAATFGLEPPDGQTATDQCYVKLYDVDRVDPGEIGEYGAVRRVDRSYRIYPGSWPPGYVEMEYMMPLDSGLDAFGEIRRMVLSDFPDHGIPTEVRFVAADDGMLSQNQGRRSIVVSVSGELGTDYSRFLDRCEAIFVRHNGRPHWGKFHRISRERVGEIFPAYDRFRELRNELDPSGIFLNPYLSRLFR
jgi:FAD/FMN-containing dehydrogenase